MRARAGRGAPAQSATAAGRSVISGSSVPTGAVFEAFTRCALSRWWGPGGVHTRPSAGVSSAHGGSGTFVMHGPDGYGLHKKSGSPGPEIAPPERIGAAARESRGEPRTPSSWGPTFEPDVARPGSEMRNGVPHQGSPTRRSTVYQTGGGGGRSKGGASSPP